jgi:hypothetical protein
MAVQRYCHIWRDERFTHAEMPLGFSGANLHGHQAAKQAPGISIVLANMTHWQVHGRCNPFCDRHVLLLLVGPVVILGFGKSDECFAVAAPDPCKSVLL